MDVWAAQQNLSCKSLEREHCQKIKSSQPLTAQRFVAELVDSLQPARVTIAIKKCHGLAMAIGVKHLITDMLMYSHGCGLLTLEIKG